MKLASASVLSLVESLFIEALPIITEEGEGPRWKFHYDHYRHDPKPDILLLGAYQHPSTGNNLVGGVNLNYLDPQQRDSLARVLPQIMQAGNLYSRYHTGKNLLPNVFDNFYRTYNSSHIRGVTPDVMYPKYGFMQAARSFLKKKLGGIFKSKAQRAKDAEPQYPDDLSGMQDTLDQTVTQLNQQATQRTARGEYEPETPEMMVARQAFQKFRMDRARQMADVERQEDEPFMQANQQFQQTQYQQGAVPPQAVSPEVQQAPPQAPLEPTAQELGQSIERERQEHQRELSDPANDIDLGESVIYWSPRAKRYIIESSQVIEEALWSRS